MLELGLLDYNKHSFIYNKYILKIVTRSFIYYVLKFENNPNTMLESNNS